MPIRAILFDFDGLLVDTEPIHYAGFRDAVAPLGIDLDEDAYYERYVGFDDRDGFAAILKDYGVDAPLSPLLERKKALVEAAMRRDLEPLPGAVDFVRAAAPDFDIGVCSGALRSEVLLGLELLGLLPWFSHIVAADDVRYSKPDPEGYVALLALLSEDAIERGEPAIEPSQAMVLEDTITGLRAGRAAGCHTVGVASTTPEAELTPLADVVVPSLLDHTPQELAAQLEPR